MALDNRNRDKTASLEEIEQEETPIDEEAADNELKQEMHQAPDDIENEYVSPDEEDEEPVVPENEEVNEEELDEAEKEAKQDKTPPVEERLKESTKEAQLQVERNKHLTDTIINIAEVKEPTEEELITAARVDGLDWDELTTAERLLVKKGYIAEKKFEKIEEASRDLRSNNEWALKVDTYLDENETSQTVKPLIGREEQFRSFAMKQSHRGLPIDVLVSHFLVTEKQPDNKSKGSLFLTNTGGLAPEKKKTAISDADSAANLRTSDPREYQRQLRAGKIKIEV